MHQMKRNAKIMSLSSNAIFHIRWNEKKNHLAILVLLDFFVVEKKYADVKKSYNVANWNIVFIFQIKKATGWLARHTNMFQLIIQCHSSATRTHTHTHTHWKWLIEWHESNLVFSALFNCNYYSNLSVCANGH